MGSITLTIAADNAEELEVHVMGMAKMMNNRVVPTKTEMARESAATVASIVGAAEKAEVKTEAKAEVKTETKAKTKNSRPVSKEEPKTEAKAEAQSENQTTIEDAIETASYSKEDVSAATQRVAAAKNLEFAREIMGRFSKADGNPCARISDIQASDYAKYIETCDAEIAG